jgi:hypothetical protein
MLLHDRPLPFGFGEIHHVFAGRAAVRFSFIFSLQLIGGGYLVSVFSSFIFDVSCAKSIE